VKLPDIMKAKKKPLDVIELASLGVSAEPGLKPVLTEAPKPRSKGIMVKDVAELVDALKKKGLV
jgi:electron transfer flavoprotein beta subunit